MRTLLCLFLVFFLPALPASAGDPSELDPGPAMERCIARYGADEESLSQFYSEPLSLERIERLDRLAVEWQERLASVNFESLDADGRVDFALFVGHLRHQRQSLAREATLIERVRPLLPFADILLDLERARRRMEKSAPADAAAQLVVARTSLRECFDALRERVKTGAAAGADGAASASLPAAYDARRAARSLDALARMTANWFRFRDGYEPEFGWWVRAPHAAFAAAAEEYSTWLRQEVGQESKGADAPLEGEVLGREDLLRALAHERIPYSPEELIAIAEKEMAWCTAEGERAARDLGVEGGWGAAVERVKKMHGPPGAQDTLVAEQGREAVAFLRAKSLVTVPALCDETWRLQMISAELQKTMPFAFYSDQAMHVAYPTEPMEHEAKLMSMRGNNPHFTRIVTPHELIPGHHLQLFMAARHRPYRERFRTPFLVEGWALHWEMLLYDLGWARGPADEIGMLFWRRHRCARILVTLRFHLGQWNAEQMVKYLVDTVGLEPDGAKGEVRRYVEGSYGPLYQCAYMLGGLQLRALYRELVGGGVLSPCAFHDAVLREGSIPVDLIRRRLGGGEISKDPPADWRFAP